MIEKAQYPTVCDDEMRDLEAEFGRPLSQELAQWFIRNRTNRQAVERMARLDSTQAEVPSSQRPNSFSLVIGTSDAKVEGELLQVLKAELQFLQEGGYRNLSCKSWRPRLILEDSPTCPNYGKGQNRQPCKGCVLTSLIPEDKRSETIPCRHIPLTSEGDTLELLYRWCSQEEIETIVGDWLQATIRALDIGRAGLLSVAPSCWSR
jgi:hypothetical protein